VYIVNNEFWTAMPSVTYHGASPRPRAERLLFLVARQPNLAFNLGVSPQNLTQTFLDARAPSSLTQATARHVSLPTRSKWTVLTCTSGAVGTNTSLYGRPGTAPVGARTTSGCAASAAERKN